MRLPLPITGKDITTLSMLLKIFLKASGGRHKVAKRYLREAIWWEMNLKQSALFRQFPSAYAGLAYVTSHPTNRLPTIVVLWHPWGNLNAEAAQVVFSEDKNT